MEHPRRNNPVKRVSLIAVICSFPLFAPASIAQYTYTRPSYSTPNYLQNKYSPPAKTPYNPELLRGNDQLPAVQRKPYTPYTPYYAPK